MWWNKKMEPPETLFPKAVLRDIISIRSVKEGEDNYKFTGYKLTQNKTQYILTGPKSSGKLIFEKANIIYLRFHKKFWPENKVV